MTGAEFIAFIRQDFSLTAAQEAAFAALDGLYREWNAKINVISRKDIDGLYDHHVLHSLAIARYLQTVPGLYEQFAASEVLDLGMSFTGMPFINVATLELSNPRTKISESAQLPPTLLG